MAFTSKGNRRGIAPVLGVILLVVIVVLLVAVSAVTFVSLGESGTEAATVQSMGRFNFDQTGTTGNVTINPDSVQSAPNAQFHLRINGRDVYQWDGHSPVELSCLVPGDEMTVVSVTDSGTSSVVQEYDFTSATKCPSLTFAERFQYAYVGPDEHNMQKVEVGNGVAFGLTINPDGPGSDRDISGFSGDDDVFKRTIDNVSLANEWHYQRAYTTGQPIEGLEPPVWVFVLTDNVHWKSIPTGSNANWTDDPSTVGSNPVNKTYDLQSTSSGRQLVPNDAVQNGGPPNGDEPTNDIYLVFKPGCPTSTLKMVAQQGGYRNTIYLDDEKIINNTGKHGVSVTTFDPPKTFEAPGVCND